MNNLLRSVLDIIVMAIMALFFTRMAVIVVAALSFSWSYASHDWDAVFHFAGFLSTFVVAQIVIVHRLALDREAKDGHYKYLGFTALLVLMLTIEISNVSSSSNIAYLVSALPVTILAMLDRLLSFYVRRYYSF